MIIGFGRVGRLVAEMLTAHDRPYVAVDSNIDAVAAGRARGLPDRSSATSPAAEFVDRLNLGHASALDPDHGRSGAGACG